MVRSTEDEPRPLSVLVMYFIGAVVIGYISPLNGTVGWLHTAWVALVVVALGSVGLAIVLNLFLRWRR